LTGAISERVTGEWVTFEQRREEKEHSIQIAGQEHAR
jgi:hypothetical protein